MDRISIGFDETLVVDCQCVLIVPERALVEGGYIKKFSTRAGAHDKHEFHALAQMAYYQAEDAELVPRIMVGSCKITMGDEHEELTSGLVIWREKDGAIDAAVHQWLAAGKLLAAAHRFCTRWIRLDI
jgi:hypothetical protein